jgi:phosphate regulon transcriptional regulator PhoB
MSPKSGNKKILIAEDEQDVLELIATNLQGAGYLVLKAEDGESAVEQARISLPALVILDIMLPGMSGLDVCKVLKQEAVTKRIPLLMLTAKAEEVDRIVGLELGADDYVTKPFSPRELVLRVRSILRRTASPAEHTDILRLGDIQVDLARHEVTVKSKSIDFTATEFKLLTMLMERRGRVQSRDTLLNEVWGYENIIDTRTVDTHIRRLREKLGKAAECIQTIRGFGYRIVDNRLQCRG